MAAAAQATHEFSMSANGEKAFSPARLCPIKHNFDRHPLMQIGRLEELAKSLAPSKQCRFISPNLTVSSAFNHKSESHDGRDIEQVFREIETPGSWVALYDIQTDPVYREFLSVVMHTARHLVGPAEKIRDIRGFIFISAPPSVTPFHIDRENNFWLQIKGRKTISVWDRTDRDVVAAKDVEDFIVYRSLDNVKLDDKVLDRSYEFDSAAGDGVYMPSTTPHMTRADAATAPEDKVSISVAICFYTDVTRRTAYVHAVNRVLRRIGLNPRSPEQDAVRDRIKHLLGRALIGWRKLSSGYVPPPSF